MKVKIIIKPEDLLIQARIVKFLKEAKKRGWKFEYEVRLEDEH